MTSSIRLILFITLAAFLMSSSCNNAAKKEITAIAGNKDEVKYTVKDVTLLTEGARVDRSHKLDIIAFDRRGEDGFYDIWTMNPDGSEEKCITHPDLPGRNTGQPAWHPSGKYLLFQAEKKEHLAVTQGFAEPGGGLLKFKPDENSYTIQLPGDIFFTTYH